jgi:hypothetical protein
VPTGTAPDGETVQPDDGAASDRDAERSGVVPGLRSVPVTVKDEVASVVDGTAASVGVSAAGAPYRAGL